MNGTASDLKQQQLAWFDKTSSLRKDGPVGHSNFVNSNNNNNANFNNFNNNSYSSGRFIASSPMLASSNNTRTSIANISTTVKKKPNQRLVYNVVNYLKIHYLNTAELDGKHVTAEELLRQTGADALNNRALFDSLQCNPKIGIDDSVHPYRFYYKPKYDVRTIDELSDLLAKSPDGIEITDLHDCYKGVTEDIRKLGADKRIFIIKNTETNRDVVYPNDPHLSVEVFPDFVRAWQRVAVPDESDLQLEMVRLGLKKKLEKDRVTQYKRPPPKERQKRNSKRKPRLVNTHLNPKEIDLTQDYSVPPPKPDK